MNERTAAMAMAFGVVLVYFYFFYILNETEIKSQIVVNKLIN